MENNVAEAVAETVIYQDDLHSPRESVYMNGVLKFVPRVTVTNRRIKVDDDIYSLQEVEQVKLATRLNRMNRSTWLITKAAWLLVAALCFGLYLGIVEDHRFLLLVLLIPFAALLAYHLGKNDEIQQAWIANLVMHTPKRKITLFVGAWCQDTTVTGYDMKQRKNYAMMVDGWQKSHDQGVQRAKVITEAVGTAIAQKAL